VQAVALVGDRAEHVRRQADGAVARDEAEATADDQQARRTGALVLAEPHAAAQGDDGLPQSVDRVRQGSGGASGLTGLGFLEQVAGERMHVDR
jgi:hypothetical protein